MTGEWIQNVLTCICASFCRTDLFTLWLDAGNDDFMKNENFISLFLVYWMCCTAIGDNKKQQRESKRNHTSLMCTYCRFCLKSSTPGLIFIWNDFCLDCLLQGEAGNLCTRPFQTLQHLFFTCIAPAPSSLPAKAFYNLYYERIFRLLLLSYTTQSGFPLAFTGTFVHTFFFSKILKMLCLQSTVSISNWTTSKILFSLAYKAIHFTIHRDWPFGCEWEAICCYLILLDLL